VAEGGTRREKVDERARGGGKEKKEDFQFHGGRHVIQEDSYKGGGKHYHGGKMSICRKEESTKVIKKKKDIMH